MHNQWTSLDWSSFRAPGLATGNTAANHTEFPGSPVVIKCHVAVQFYCKDLFCRPPFSFFSYPSPPYHILRFKPWLIPSGTWFLHWLPTARNCSKSEVAEDNSEDATKASAVDEHILLLYLKGKGTKPTPSGVNF